VNTFAVGRSEVRKNLEKLFVDDVAAVSRDMVCKEIDEIGKCVESPHGEAG
jgi:hypothetical protein